MDVLREFHTGALRLRVLHHAAQSPIHGAALAEELATRGHRVSPGTLYPLLHRMQEAGLLKSATTAEAGRRLRRYRTTKRGKRLLEACLPVVTDLARDLGTPIA
ncbi:PadR family transcriptional regulator [Actinokineospora guangxiensis]|uniref:PadR family transcriptional regulator n=1 Tax=Actinokineospora guangxiensis TaxID=1490288 RepID=A0ABW0EQ26_9PSEU